MNSHTKDMSSFSQCDIFNNEKFITSAKHVKHLDKNLIVSNLRPTTVTRSEI